MKRSYLIAAGVAAAVAGWILSGQMNGANQPPEPDPQPVQSATVAEEMELAAVRVRRLVAAERVNELVLFGRTEAVRTVDVKAETSGRVVSIAVKKGQQVPRGAVLARIAMDDRKAGLTEAEALVEQQRIAYEAAQALSQKAFRSKVKLAENLAQLEAAKAALEHIRLDIAHTTIHAPFAGIVEGLPVEVGDYLGVGSVVAGIVDLDPVLIVAEVSERDVAMVAVGAAARARLVGGREVEGSVRYVSRMGASATRTFRVEVAVDNPDGALSEGLTAELRLPLGMVKAHRVSPAVLTLSDAGVIGVKTVGAGDIVEFHRVELIADTPEGMWLGGLPESLTLITVGQEFVRAGQRVKPVQDKSDEPS